eukprot:5910620-Ditylum_brightwellii.AAC.1
MWNSVASHVCAAWRPVAASKNVAHHPRPVSYRSTPLYVKKNTSEPYRQCKLCVTKKFASMTVRSSQKVVRDVDWVVFNQDRGCRKRSFNTVSIYYSSTN